MTQGGAMVRGGNNNAKMIDTNGDRVYDRVQFNVISQGTAILIDPDGPNAAMDSALAFCASVKRRPFKSFREIAGWVCLALFFAGIAIAIVRRGEPEPNSKGISAFAPQNLGTRFGYFVKKPVQGAFSDAGDYLIKTETDSNAIPQKALTRESAIEAQFR